MSLLEEDVVLVGTTEEGGSKVALPITRANNVEGLGRCASTAYTVDDVVYVDSNMQVALKCTQGGITSTEELDLTGKAVGAEVEDGSVKWKLVPRSESKNIESLSKSLVDANTAISYNASAIADNTKAIETLSEDVEALQANQNAGLAPANCYNRRIEKSGSTVRLMWRDPEPTVVEGNTLADWTQTVVVKKQGGYPESPADGTVVVTTTTKNQYATTAFVDTQGNPEEWYYRAFPYNKGKYSESELNKFGFFSYAIYIDEDDPVEETCVHKVPGYDNYLYDFMSMNFSTDEFYWGDWKDEQWIPKPCMLTFAGEVDYYLNPDDYTKKADDSASDVTDTSYGGNAMMEWSTIFTKVERVGSKLYMYFASHKLDDDYECYSTLKSDGTYGEHFYMPIYEGSVISSKLRSMSTGAKPTASTTGENEATYAIKNGSGWNTTVWADENLLAMVGVLCFGRLNIQKALGYNCGSSSSGLTHNCGSGNTKGMFYGKESTSSYATKYFGSENWYGHRWRRCNGLLLLNTYEVWVKMTKHTGDGSTVSEYNRTGAGYIKTGLTVPSASESYIKQVQGSKYGAFIPRVNSGGSSTTYYCDAAWSATGLRQLVLGGSVYDGVAAGLFAFGVYGAPSDSAWSRGASVSYKPF